MAGRGAHSVKLGFITLEKKDDNTLIKSKEQRAQCVIKNNTMKVKSIETKECIVEEKIVDFDQIKMNGTLSISTHQFENIIALEKGKDTIFFKFDSRKQMEDWYSQLMKPLRRLGWNDDEVTVVDGLHRCATNPEVRRRQNPPVVPPKTHNSAYATLENGFDSRILEQQDTRKVIHDGEGDSHRFPLGAVGGISSMSDYGKAPSNMSNSRAGAVGGKAGLSEDDTTSPNSPSGAVGGRPSLSKDDLTSSNSPDCRTIIIGDNNIAINSPRDSVNFQVASTFDTSMITEIVDQVTKALIPRLSTELFSILTSQNNQRDQAFLEQNTLLKDVISKIEANGGHVYKVGKGSIIFFIRFETKSDLERFWKAYNSGNLVKDLCQCLIMKELEKQSGQQLDIQLKFQESEYKRGLELLDSAATQNQPTYVIPSKDRHTYMNVDSNNKVKPEVPKRKESIADLLTRQGKPTETAHTKLTSNNTDNAYEVPIIQSRNISENVYDESPTYTPLTDSPTVKPYTPLSFKAELENTLTINRTRGIFTMKTMRPKLNSNLVEVYDYAYCPVDPSADSSPIHMPQEDEVFYETLDEIEGTVTPKSKSLHIPSPEAEQSQWRRQQTVPPTPAAPLKPSKPKSKPKATTRSQPQVPLRFGKTLASAMKLFQSQQGEELITVYLSPKDALRLALVKIDGLMYAWLNHWDSEGCTLEEKVHPGDQILSIHGVDMRNVECYVSKAIMENVKEEKIKLTIRRAPHAHMLYIRRSPDTHDLGIEIKGNVITKVLPDGLFREHSKVKTTAVLSNGDLVNWAITEINMYPVNYNHSTSQIRDLLDKAVTEVVLVIQPSDLVQAMRDALD